MVLLTVVQVLLNVLFYMHIEKDGVELEINITIDKLLLQVVHLL